MSSSSDLATRYQRYLRLYPRKWRSRNGAALIGTMLEVAAVEQRTRPSRQDRLDLIVGALDARFAFWDPHGRLAETALGLGLGGGLAYLVSSWDPNHRGDVGPFANPTFIAVTAWLAAYFAVIAHKPTPARWCVLAAIALHIAIETIALAAPVSWLGPSLSVTVLFITVGLIAIARPVRRQGAITTAALIPGLLIAALSAVARLVAG